MTAPEMTCVPTITAPAPSGPSSWTTTIALALLLGVSSVEPARALDPERAVAQYAFRTWSKRDGLPGSWVSAILPSRPGYLWAATQEGLVRFDGTHFTVFTRGNSPGLPSDNIRALHAAKDGRIFVATSRGLAVGDAQTGSFVPVPGLPAAPVVSIDEDGTGVLWALTADAAWRVEGGRATILEGLRHQQGENRALRGIASGGFWVATNRGLIRIDPGGAPTTFTVGDGLPSNDVLSVLVDRDGVVWAGTGQGVARLSNGGAFEPVAASMGHVTEALVQDRDGNVWAGTRDGLQRLAGGRAELIGRAEGLPDEHTRALAEDADGNLWIGTEAGGLTRVRNGRATVYGTGQGLRHNVIWSVTESHDGSIWVGTDGGGLNRLREGRGLLATTEPDFAHEKVYALLEDRSGRVFFSTESHGLCTLASGRARCMSVPDDDLVRCLIEDRHGGIWVSTSGGVYRLGEDGLRLVPSEDGKRLVAKVLDEGPDGVIWVGTSSGLARVEGGLVRRVLANGAPHTDDISALHSDPDGTLWIGTLNAGLQRLRGGRLAAVLPSQGLPTAVVLSVLDDGLGRIWLSGGGIVALARADLEAAADGRGGPLEFAMITEADGLRDQECSGGVQPSAWRGRDGRLWFPTISGVAVVDPQQVHLNTRPLSVLIEGIVADGQMISPDGPIVLPAGTRHLEIRYTAPSFAAPERVRFEHRLEGLEKSFFPAGTDRVAHYSGLGPGHYRFTIRAANEDGVWADRTTSLTFEVRPHFWQTLWFYALCGAALLVGAWATGEWRVRALRLREQELERRVAEEMAQVRVLKGMLPICSWCKQVRDDAGYWKQLEAYVSDHSEAEFTHGICPECLIKFKAEARL
jgi:ligand-binding sensor domain-containing protein